MIANALILIFTHNGLLQPFPCHPVLACDKMKVLDMSFNKISRSHKHNFACLPHLIQMILDHNEITLIVESLFKNLRALKVLSLNSNKITSLLKCSFCSLNDLVLLNLLNNNILFVDSIIFGSTKLHLIMTDEFSCMLHVFENCICLHCQTNMAIILSGFTLQYRIEVSLLVSRDNNGAM